MRPGSYVTFSEILCSTGELDPVYNMLNAARKDVGDRVVMRFMTAFHMFYHIGFAAKLAEMDTSHFWGYVEGEHYRTHPRGKERRHFRGQNGINSINSIKQFGDPANFIQEMIAPTYKGIHSKVRQIIGFGDYFTWKVADMQDRCLGIPVNWDGAEKYLHKVPVKGAMLIAEEEGWATDEGIIPIMNKLQECLGHIMAPPTMDRPIHIAEIETILCAWKGYIKGSYKIGSDIDHKRAELVGYGDLADHLAQYLPESMSIEDRITADVHVRQPIMKPSTTLIAVPNSSLENFFV